MGREISKKTEMLQDKYEYPKVLSLQLDKYSKTYCLTCGYYYKRRIESSKVCPRCRTKYGDKVKKINYF